MASNKRPGRSGPRTNEEILAGTIRLINEEGENVGTVSVEEALEMAIEAGLDLVEIVANTDPRVCKILDAGKFKYQEQKRRAAARKNQKTTSVKELKFRPGIDSHDYGVKMNNLRKFISNGDKVKVTLRFRGRELSHQQIGFDLLARLQKDLGEAVKVDQAPTREGRQVVLILSPK